MKKTKTKPLFVVDITNVETCEDMRLAFLRAKATSGAGISNDDFEYILGYDYKVLSDEVLNTLDTIIDVCNDILTSKVCRVNKTPWYKRFWNWITRKNKK
jgi:hypothetical protein